MSKGKKNYHVFRNAYLNHVITFYDNESSDKKLPPIRINIIHTDKFPTR